MNYEREYLDKAFAALENWLYLLPSDVQRSVKLARSVHESHGSATSEELRRELGSNWVLAKRTKRIIEKYGEDVKCYSSEKYEAAQRRAIESRFPESPSAAEDSRIPHSRKSLNGSDGGYGMTCPNCELLASDTSHLEKVQEWECQKAEMLYTLRRIQTLAAAMLHGGTGDKIADIAQAVIRKYEVKQ